MPAYLLLTCAAFSCFWFPQWQSNQSLCSLRAVECYDESKEYVLKEVREAGINVDMIDKLIQCESGWRQNAVGFNKNGLGKDRGLWQWNSKFHPEISDDCAFSPKCSTEKAIQHISKYGLSAWSCLPKILLKKIKVSTKYDNKM